MSVFRSVCVCVRFIKSIWYSGPLIILPYKKVKVPQCTVDKQVGHSANSVSVFYKLLEPLGLCEFMIIF